MTRGYIFARLWQTLPMLLGVVVIGFLLVHIAPGDPILALAGENGDEAYYAAMRERYGLDQPLANQLGTYLWRLAQGDLGTSAIQKQPVSDVILDRLPNTLLLAGTALVISTLGGVLAGLWAASRVGGWRDRTVAIGTLLMYALPVFWLGQIAILWFGLRWGWFPVQGRTDARSRATGLAHVLDVAHHLALPALVLASQQIAVIARLTRATLVDALRSPHIDAARARGVSESRILVRHALPAALLPVVTVVGNRVGHLVSGAVVIEIVFGWPGIGRLLVSATNDRDIPVLLGLFLLIGFAVLIANLLTDITYKWLDPRIRIG
ncbi:MAG: ABC transporter permease [Ilumatobacter sp.]|nr:ABC transporter permease [Ilumatobacter sp.]